MSNTYDEMRKIIINSEKFSDEEKLRRLNELAEQETESKKKCGEAIKGNRENVAKIALEVFKGLLTCGISFAPAIVKNFKSAFVEEKDVLKIEVNSERFVDDNKNSTQAITE